MLGEAEKSKSMTSSHIVTSLAKRCSVFYFFMLDSICICSFIYSKKGV